MDKRSLKSSTFCQQSAIFWLFGCLAIFLKIHLCLWIIKDRPFSKLLSTFQSCFSNVPFICSFALTWKMWGAKILLVSLISFSSSSLVLSSGIDRRAWIVWWELFSQMVYGQTWCRVVCTTVQKIRWLSRKHNFVNFMIFWLTLHYLVMT